VIENAQESWPIFAIVARHVFLERFSPEIDVFSKR
jgi:hypothetical protein